MSVLKTVIYGGIAAALAVASVPGYARSDAARIALDYIDKHKHEFGLTASDTGEAEVASIVPSRHNNVTHVYVQQKFGGIEVVHGIFTVNIRSDDTIIQSGNRFVRDLEAAAGSQIVDIDPVAAAQAAAEFVGLDVTDPFEPIAVIGGPDEKTLLSDGGIAARPIVARLVWLNTDDFGIRLAWSVEIEQTDAEHHWFVYIDAGNGMPLAREDLVVHDSFTGTGAADTSAGAAQEPAANPPEFPETDGAIYKVYPFPMESPNDGDQLLVTNVADPFASPLGWHDTGSEQFTITRGNNVQAYDDRLRLNQADPTNMIGITGRSADGDSSLVFDFDHDQTAQPVDSLEAAITNLFYWNNVMHDVSYNYGFDEAAGNFQVNNFGNGGAGNDEVRAEAQDGSGTNNANFSTPADGSPPRMQMFLWNSSSFGASDEPNRDGDFDSGVIAHEYGHGISNRLTGGRTVVNCLGNAEQMGEGWSDWFGLTLSAKSTDTATLARGIGAYVIFEPGDGPGIRPTPYTTDLNVNPSTYAAVADTANISRPHGIGYVWNTMLWEVYWNLVEKHGFNSNIYEHWLTGGNNLAFQLVMDGMKFQPCRPGFVDGRDAILAADVALTGGANQCEIWRGFAKRGLGLSAAQGDSNNRSDGVESFDLPESCTTDFVEVPTTVESQVSDLVSMLIDNTSFSGGQTSFDLGLENISTAEIFTPLRAEIVEFESASGTVTVANADNGAQGVGALWRYDEEVGENGILEPSAVSGSRRLIFSNNGESFRLTLDIVGRLRPSITGGSNGESDASQATGDDSTGGLIGPADSGGTVLRLSVNPLLGSIQVQPIDQF